MLLVRMCSNLKSALKYKVLILVFNHHIYVSNDVRICGYFGAPNGDWEQKRLENTGLVRAVLMCADRRTVDGRDEVTGSCCNCANAVHRDCHCGIQSALKQCSL